MRIREELSHEYLIALSLNTRGLIEYMANSPYAGKRYSKKALKIFEYVGDNRGVGLACRVLGGISARIGDRDQSLSDLEQAEVYLLRAIDIFTRGGVPREPVFMAETYDRMGLMYNSRRNLSRIQGVGKLDLNEYFLRARFCFQRSIIEYERGKSTPRQAEALGRLARLYIESDKLPDADLEIQKMERVLRGALDSRMTYSRQFLWNIKKNTRVLLLIDNIQN